MIDPESGKGSAFRELEDTNKRRVLLAREAGVSLSACSVPVQNGD